jgi:flagellar assembly factor FliW
MEAIIVWFIARRYTLIDGVEISLNGDEISRNVNNPELIFFTFHPFAAFPRYLSIGIPSYLLITIEFFSSKLMLVVCLCSLGRTRILENPNLQFAS